MLGDPVPYLRFITMRRAVIVMLAIGVLLEISTWYMPSATLSDIMIEGMFSIASLGFAFGGIIIVIFRLSTSQRIKFLIYLAIGLVVASEILNITGKPQEWATIPLLGSEGYMHGGVEKLLQVIGIVLFIGCMSLSLWETHNSNRALRLAGEELRQSEANFRVLAETSAAATFIHRGGNFLYVNNTMCNMSGYSREELLAMRFWDVLAPESKEDVRERGKARLSGDDPPSRYEIIVITKDKKRKWCDLTVARIMYEAQITVLGAFFDITDRKQAEEVLAQERDLLKLLIDNMPDCIYFKDAQSRFIMGNQALLRLMGVKKLEEIVGRNDFDFFPKRLAEEYYEDEQRLVQNAQAMHNKEETVGSIHGEEHFLLTTKVPMLDANNKVTGIIGIGRDITDLRRTQEALKSREHFLADIFASIQDGISVLDSEMRIIRVNPAIEQWFAARMPLVGRTCYEAYYNRTQPCEICPTLTAFQTGQGAIEVVPKRNAEGEIIGWLDLHSFPLFDRDTGEISGIIEYVRDISEQKSLENQLRHAQKLESLGVLAGGIAHDFNNLLVGMQGYAGLALMNLSNESVARGYVEKVEAAARRAAELTNQMLAYSGKGAFVKQHVDISKLVEDVGRLVAASISKKAVLRYNCASDLPQVVADAAQLHQVVMNLLINASDALGDNPGVITLNTGLVSVDRQYLASTYINDDLPDGRYVSLEVSDTGCGMDRETLGKIFDPFFSTKFAGRGLGLAAVLGIVRGHKGAIKVYSEPGQGTTFKVLLPATETDKSTAQSNKPVGDTASEGWRGKGVVLVADDEETVRSVTKEVLTHFGFSVLLAENGREALEMFKEHSGELVAVLLDLTMPVMSGQEVFQEIQKMKTDVPIVMSSGYTQQDVSERFTGQRPAAFIQKPYIHTELLAKLRSAIEAEPSS